MAKKRITCEICGVDFYVYPSVNRKYCSNKCKKSGMSITAQAIWDKRKYEQESSQTTLGSGSKPPKSLKKGGMPVLSNVGNSDTAVKKISGSGKKFSYTDKVQGVGIINKGIDCSSGGSLPPITESQVRDISKVDDVVLGKYFMSGIIGDWYLRDDQLPLYEMLYERKKVVVNTHRRFGKSTTVFVYIFERCIREKIVARVGGITQKSFKEIFNSLSEEIFSRCVVARPKYSARDDCWKFSNGSRIYLFGVKDKDESDKARGNLAHIIYCDEYGFWKYKANYTLTSVLSPQLDTTDGQLIITSTIPPDITHDFISQISDAKAGGYYFTRDIHDSLASGVVSEVQHEKIISRCGGIDSDAYKIEYELKLVGAADRLVIPEAGSGGSFGTVERPSHFQSYVCMDLGLVDNTAALFGYIDFTKGVLVVEREWCKHYKSTAEIVKAVRKIEGQLGYDKPKRFGDSEMQQLFDMNNTFNYPIVPVVKRKKETHIGYRDSIINNLRVGLGRVVIDDLMCPNLAKQLRYGIWNERRSDFERTDSMGHLDALMALCYLFDNVNWGKNPFPTGKYDEEGRRILPSTHHINVNPNKKSLRDIL